MSVYLRAGSPNFVCELMVQGRKFRRSTGTSSRKDAMMQEAIWRAELLRGECRGLRLPSL